MDAVSSEFGRYVAVYIGCVLLYLFFLIRLGKAVIPFHAYFYISLSKLKDRDSASRRELRKSRTAWFAVFALLALIPTIFFGMFLRIADPPHGDIALFVLISMFLMWIGFAAATYELPRHHFEKLGNIPSKSP